jgi:hypothetical protein
MKSIGAVLSGTIVVLLAFHALAGLAARGVVLDALAFATVFWACGRRRLGATFGFVIDLCADERALLASRARPPSVTWSAGVRVVGADSDTHAAADRGDRRAPTWSRSMGVLSWQEVR